MMTRIRTRKRIRKTRRTRIRIKTRIRKKETGMRRRMRRKMRRRNKQKQQKTWKKIDYFSRFVILFNDFTCLFSFFSAISVCDILTSELLVYERDLIKQQSLHLNCIYPKFGVNFRISALVYSIIHC